MKRKTNAWCLFIGAALLVFSSLGCEANCAEIPEAGTTVTTGSAAFQQLVRALDQNDCQAMGGCTCILDGIQTPCSIVFACLDAGLCERVATTD